MDKHVFRKEILGLYKFFRKRKADLPDEETVDDWYEFLKQFPNNAFREAIKRLKSQDKLPFNIPKALKDSWGGYVSDNPGMITRNKNYMKCKDCGSSGAFLILLHNRAHRRLYQYVVPCSKCNNWQKLFSNSGAKRVSAETLIRKNIPFKPYNHVLPVDWDDNGYIGKGSETIFNGHRERVA